MTSSEVWTAEAAERYDEDSAEHFTPDVLGPQVERLVALAGDGPVLELAVGTGRVAVPLHERGVEVHGVELSAPMVAKVHEKVGDAIPVTVGDMASTILPEAGRFSLVYLVFNTLSNLRTQDEQVECFRTAARHLRPGGRFLVELWVPPIQKLGAGGTAVPMALDEQHLVFDTYDLATQACASHHYRVRPDGTVTHGIGHFRYAWPAELDLMARLAGLEPESRSADWHGAPFTAESTSHVSVWRLPG